MPFTTLVVDDEPLAREGLKILLSRDRDIETIYEAKDGREAVAAIRKYNPELVFLDMQMPEMDGLSVVSEIGAEQMPAVVFVTAHDRYAIDAFELNAVDYVLKPVTEERFFKALDRAKTRLHIGPAEHRQILSLLETVANRQRQLKRVAVRSGGKTTFVDIDDVDWIEAAENYVELHVGRLSHLVHVTLTTFEKSLDAELFIRIHRSIIVNVRRIKELQPALHGEYVITLENGVKLQSGRSYNERMKALAANPF